MPGTGPARAVKPFASYSSAFPPTAQTGAAATTGTTVWKMSPPALPSPSTPCESRLSGGAGGSHGPPVAAALTENW